MSGMWPIVRPPTEMITCPQTGMQTQATVTATVRSGEYTKFSTVSRVLGKITELPEVRMHIVERNQDENTNSICETPDKIEALLDELTKDLFQTRLMLNGIR